MNLALARGVNINGDETETEMRLGVGEKSSSRLNVTWKSTSGGATPLMSAAKVGFISCLMKHRSGSKKHANYKVGYVDIVHVLIRAGADLNRIDKVGFVVA